MIPSHASRLAGLRVMVVEDEMLISILIEDLLSDEGCEIVGPFDRVAAALPAAERETIDFALLDINVAGTKVYPVADILASRGVPFLFLTGYGESGIPAGHREWQACQKPFKVEELLKMIGDRIDAA